MAFFEFPHTRSYDTDLGWLIKEYDSLKSDYDTLTNCCEDVQNRLAALESLYNQIMSGNFPETIRAAFVSWMRENAVDLIGELVHSVYFGLTNAGYFAAYIPASWSEFLEFDTVVDADNPLYGHLLLRYA